MDACPCGRVGTFGGGLPYERCCGRYLDDAATPAPDAESLMRSRYTAYALGRTEYLRDTWDPGHCPEQLDLDPRLRWTGLDVRDHSEQGDRAEVSFEARYLDARGREGGLRERSRFVRRGGRWFYIDGDVS
jgi:SEC-C motif-containing protein